MQPSSPAAPASSFLGLQNPGMLAIAQLASPNNEIILRELNNYKELVQRNGVAVQGAPSMSGNLVSVGQSVVVKKPISLEDALAESRQSSSVKTYVLDGSAKPSAPFKPLPEAPRSDGPSFGISGFNSRFDGFLQNPVPVSSAEPVYSPSTPAPPLRSFAPDSFKQNLAGQQQAGLKKAGTKEASRWRVIEDLVETKQQKCGC